MALLLSLIFANFAFGSYPAQPYPTHWWQKFPTQGKPTWEILPHEAKPPEVILSKRNELGILSNFAAMPNVRAIWEKKMQKN